MIINLKIDNSFLNHRESKIIIYKKRHKTSQKTSLIDKNQKISQKFLSFKKTLIKLQHQIKSKHKKKL